MIFGSQNGRGTCPQHLQILPGAPAKFLRKLCLRWNSNSPWANSKVVSGFSRGWLTARTSPGGPSAQGGRSTAALRIHSLLPMQDVSTAAISNLHGIVSDLLRQKDNNRLTRRFVAGAHHFGLSLQWAFSEGYRLSVIGCWIELPDVASHASARPNVQPMSQRCAGDRGHRNATAGARSAR